MRYGWDWLRLSYQRQRWEVFLILAGAVAAAGGMLLVANQVEELRALRDSCLGQIGAHCDEIVASAYEPTQTAQRLLSLAQFAPFFIGIILGAPLVAREIEFRTAPLAWVLSGSRRRWFIRRVLFVVVVAVAGLALLSWTSEVIAALITPERDLARDFDFAEMRGPILIARGFLVLALAVLTGAVLGRVLPALLATMLIVPLVFIGIGLVDGAILRAEAMPVRVDPETGTGELSDNWVDTGLLLTDGTAITWEEVDRRGLRGRDPESQMAFTQDGSGCWYASAAKLAAGEPVGCEIAWVVAGARYPEITSRRAAMLAGTGIAVLVAAAAVVQRRRPE